MKIRLCMERRGKVPMILNFKTTPIGIGIKKTHQLPFFRMMRVMHLKGRYLHSSISIKTADGQGASSMNAKM